MSDSSNSPGPYGRSGPDGHHGQSFPAPNQQPHPHPPGQPWGPQYSQWYNPNDAPARARNFTMGQLFTKPVYLLLIISAVLYVISRVVGAVAQAQRPGIATGGQETAAETISFLLGFGFVLVIVLGLYLLTLIPITVGKNWGRVVGFVFAGLGIFMQLIGLIGVHLYGGVAIVLVVLAVAFIGVNIAWIVVAALTWERRPQTFGYPLP